MKERSYSPRISASARVSRRQLLRGASIAGMGVAAWGLIGCTAGDDDRDEGVADPAGGNASPTSSDGADEGRPISFNNYTWEANEPASAPAPQRGGRLVATVGANVPHLDPTLTNSYAMHAAALPVYNGLLRPVYAPEEEVVDAFQLAFTGDLAKGWEQPDEVTYTFELHDANWQNVSPVDGRPFVAEDVQYALEYWESTGVQQAAFDLVESIDVVDEHTVQVTLSEPNVDFLETALAEVQNVMFPREIPDADGDLQGRAVGTGPFIMREYRGDVRVLFEANPDYFKPDLPYLDEYELAILVDPAARLTAFRGGQLEVGATSRADEVSAVLGSRPDARAFGRNPLSATWMFNTNNHEPPFHDARVRQALSMAIDREQIIDIVYGGRGVNLPPLPWPYIWDTLEEATSAERLGPYFRHDPEEAARLLDAAGYGDGLDLHFGYYIYDESHTQIAELFQQHVSEVGISADVESMEYTAWVDYFLGQGYGAGQVAKGFHSSKSVYLGDFIYNFMHSESPRNVHHIDDPEIDELVIAQRREFDSDARRELLRELWAIDVERMYRIPEPEDAGQSVSYIGGHVENAWPSRASLFPTFGSQQAEVIFVRE